MDIPALFGQTYARFLLLDRCDNQEDGRISAQCIPNEMVSADIDQDGLTFDEFHQHLAIGSFYQNYLSQQLTLYTKPEKLAALLDKTHSFNNFGQCNALLTLTGHFPPIMRAIEDLENWLPYLLAIENDFQGIIFCEMVNRGVIKKPQDVDRYAAFWQNGPILHGAQLEHQSSSSEDRQSYSELLSLNLNAQDLQPQDLLPGTAFYAPLMVTDLNSGEKAVIPAEFRLIDNHRILVLVENLQGELKAGVYNPQDISSIKYFFRAAFPQEEQYLLYYFPKLTFSSGGWDISLDYAQIDTFHENVLGKITWEENFTRANERFLTAYSEEDTMLQKAKENFATMLDAKTLDKMRQEPPLSPVNIFQLMFAMRLSSCDKLAPPAFGLTEIEYKGYEDKVYALLERETPVTREAFLVEAIEACDERAALAAVISYNILFKMGEICYNSLFTSYPDTFIPIEEVQDQAGSIYHFYGCFFSAYALQRWLVEPYNTDTAFKESIDKAAGQIDFHSTSFYDPEEMIAEKLFDNLQYIQYRLLKLGSKKAKEVMTLTGVFYEEVLLDRDITWEVREDFAGSSTGYAVYELVSGNTLSSNGGHSSFDALLRNSYVSALTSAAEHLFGPED
ncbi:MAG: hypothetical protein QME05_01435 [Candidatus Margulisbacteria bacterium]|nr:hypothetical protein [Candidatus Margulisiibacteriota bacterium]